MHRIPRRLGVRRHILIDPRATADERVDPDPHELMNRNQAADDRAVVDGDVPGHLDGVRDDHVVADHAVVRDVDIGHQEAARADRRLAGRRAAPIDRGILTNDRAVADLHPRLFAFVLEVLWIVADDRAVADLHAVTHARIALEDGMRRDAAALADRHARADHAIRPDRDVGAELGRRVDQRGPVNHRSTTIAIISASATTWPSTNPAPFMRHVLPRNCSISSSNRI